MRSSFHKKSPSHPPPTNDDFLYRDVPAFGRRVHRLGLATNLGIDGEDLEWALGEGINYIFWTPSARRVTTSLKAAIKRNRESLIVVSGPTTGYYGGSIRRACDRLLEKLETDYLDIFQLFWLGRTSALTQSTIDALVSLREAGKVRAIGVSIHDRKRAVKKHHLVDIRGPGRKFVVWLGRRRR